MFQARKSRDRGFGNEVVASIVADLLNKNNNKKGVSWIRFFITGDVTPVYNDQRR